MGCVGSKSTPVQPLPPKDKKEFKEAKKEPRSTSTIDTEPMTAEEGSTDGKKKASSDGKKTQVTSQQSRVHTLTKMQKSF